MAGDSAHALSRRRVLAVRTPRRGVVAVRRAATGTSAAPVLSLMRANEWLVMHDLKWPNRAATIDHVVAGPPGVFVVSVRNWVGPITVDDGALRCGGALRAVTVGEAADAAAAVSELLPGITAVPVLCFPRPEVIEGSSRGVLLCSTENILDLLLSQPGFADPQTQDTVSRTLRSSLRPADRTLRRQAETARQGGAPGGKHGADRAPTEPRRHVRWLISAVLAAAVVLAGVTLQPRIHEWVSSLRGQDQVTTTLGQTVLTDRTSFHPTLQIRAYQLGRVKAVGASVAKGQRLIAVRLQIHNTGTSAFRLHGWTRVRIVDVQGVVHAPAAGIDRIGAGPLLPSSLRLRPGTKASGYVAFSLASGVKIRQVRVDLAPSGERIMWSVQ